MLAEILITLAIVLLYVGLMTNRGLKRDLKGILDELKNDDPISQSVRDGVESSLKMVSKKIILYFISGLIFVGVWLFLEYSRIVIALGIFAVLLLITPYVIIYSYLYRSREYAKV